MANWCKSCKYYGESSLSYPCVVCERAYDNPPTKHKKNVQETGWISVKDGLPEIIDTFLCSANTKTILATDGCDCYVGKFCIHESGMVEFLHALEDWFDSYYVNQRENITHWMPLPEPPEGE